jgi:hypothetical protein
MSILAFALTPRRRRAFGPLLATEMKIGLRRPVGAFVAVAIPLILLVIFGSIPATTRPEAALRGISFFTLYVPTLLVFILIAVGLGACPSSWLPIGSRACCADSPRPPCRHPGSWPPS